MRVIELNQVSAAAWAGVSVNTFRKWKIPPTHKKGRENFYDVRDVAMRIYSGEAEVEKDLNLTQERAHLAKVQREKYQVELDALRGDYFPASVLDQIWATVFIRYREQLLALKNKLGEYGSKGFIDKDIGNELGEFITDTLEELSRFEPLGGSSDLEADQGDIEDGTETTNDGEPVGGPLPDTIERDGSEPREVADQ